MVWPGSRLCLAFHMVVPALLYDFYEGEKTHELITVLEKARETPTVQLWVDCFIAPTIIAHKLASRKRG